MALAVSRNNCNSRNLNSVANAGPIDTLFTTDKAYWNIAASLWGYYYGELARLGTSAIAASQLTGYPPATWKGIVMPDGKFPEFPDACANKSR